MALFLWLPMRVLDRYVLNTRRTIDLIFLTGLATLIGFWFYWQISGILKIKERTIFEALFRRIINWGKMLYKDSERIETKELIESTTEEL